MGTKVQNLPRYYSMRDLNEESSSCGWPLFYGDKTLTNGQHYHNHLLSTTADACSAYDKDILKQKMLEHEATFKNQVFELHHLYRIQRDLMGEVNMKELHKNKIPVETSFSKGPLASQIKSEDGKIWYSPGFPIGSSTCARPSISGVEGSHSQLHPSKAISKQDSMFPSPNESSSKHVEVLESRPSKVRRRMFDLHLPADEYIDTEESEKLSYEKRSGTTIVFPYRNCNHDVNLKTGSQEDSPRPEQSLRNRNGLFDLNEAVEVEEINNASHSPTLNHYPYQGETDCSDLSAKQKLKFFCLSRDDLLNSHHGTDSWARNNGYLESGSGKGLILSGLEAGKAKSKLKPIPQVFKQEQSLLSCHKMQDALSRAHKPTSDCPTNESKADLLWEKAVSNLDISKRNHEYTTNKYAESVVSSHRPGLFAIAPSPDLAKSWSHSASSLEMTISSLNQKLASAQTPPWLNASGALSRSSQSHQNNGILGDIWPQHINSKSHLGFRCEVPVQNGFYHGSSSGCKELSADISSISYDYLNHNNDDDHKRIHVHSSNGSAKYYESSNSNCNKQSGKVINFNVLLSNGSSNMLVTQSGLGIMDGEQKHEEQLAILPWLRAKTAGKNDVQNAARGLTTVELSLSHVTSLSGKDETGLGSSRKVMHNVTSGFCFNDIEPRRAKVSESCGIKEILGVPIFDRPHISVKESSSLTSPSVSVPEPSDVELLGAKQKTQVFDINLPCDDDVLELDKQAVPEIIVSEKGSPTKEAKSRNQIDLNLSMSEDEKILVTIPTCSVQVKADIDLEAPAVPERERGAVREEKQIETPLVSPVGTQYTVEQPQDEIMRYAAEAIVAMSSLCCNQVDDVIDSPSESPVTDLLNWFVDVVSLCADNWERKYDNSRERDGEDNEESYSQGLDYFEAMTLKLPETKEEDYMPKPLVPENLRVEETDISLPTRTRKGPVRRGRQWRDFQMDILPGLTSLSRHEVTEDLQAFDGLMRATGHSWHSGLTRRSYSRNGCGRGKRRSQVTRSPPPPVATIEMNTPLVQQLNNIEARLEDRGLTGWGKTPRRPRRQRCPAGNPILHQSG
ncbi:hypothetical protein Lal_00016092 [Lupinus albus]|uniref:Uncharacterized protein n=1 Tax=Lupinus albus TaxID=3870 RepID=A0A6A5MP20_LUPAL|nr:hypothetical protein Lalb_Chr05g0220121 [Lupinus albus]KAF1872980.1 hypothetical protein Lal_00016092 [Lupinus albus]